MLVALFSDVLVLWFFVLLVAELVLLLLALLEADALCEALLAVEELAFCAALAEVESVAAFFVLAAFEAELTFEFELSLDADWLALLDASVLVPDVLLVALLADAPLDALRLLAAVPEVVDVLPPLDDGLLNAELPTDVDEPFLLADAVLEVELELAVLLLVLPLLAEALSVEAADFTLLAFCALLEVEELDVVSDLLALLEAEDMSVVAALLLALAF